jgi:predicted nucleic acid-binding Zn ribbon protein
VSTRRDHDLSRRERSEEAHRVGEVLEGLVGERALASGIPLGRLARDWEAVVGPKLAEVTEPAGLDRGALLLRVATSAWAAQVRFLAADIARQANSVLGKETVREVGVTVGPVGGKGRRNAR